MSLAFDPKPVALEGAHVCLEPLDDAHAADLVTAGADPAIWRFTFPGPFANVDAAREYIGAARTAADQLAFAIVHRASGRAIGSTRYGSIRREHRSLEIGWTWLDTAHQRSPVNTECKRLLLGHAFDTLDALRVEFKTDARNEPSRAALLRIGATYEGTFRRHMRLADGTVRDSACFSITDHDWPEVRAHLDRLIARRTGA